MLWATRTSRSVFALLAFLTLCLTGARAYAENVSQEVAWYTSPAFIDDNQKVWAVREIPDQSKQFFLISSADFGGTWQTFGSQLPADLNQLPSSVFVYAGHAFIAEAAKPCGGSRVFSVDLSTQAISTIRWLDPTATILPWGWSLDGAGNLWAGQYGLPMGPDTPGGCQLPRGINVSYVLKIADSLGNAVAASAADAISKWIWPFCSSAPDCFAEWLAPYGATADRHVHNLRYDGTRGVFLINSGDSPRASLIWSGNVNTAPTVVPNCCVSGYVLPGFTGSAPLADAWYVGDDWTVIGADHRENSIRKYPWNGSALGSPVTVLTLPFAYDSPIYDLHASGQTELFFVNNDEPRNPNEVPPPTRVQVGSSGLFRVVRSSATAAFPSTPELLFHYDSSWRNIYYIAADKNNTIPTAMPYVFVSSRRVNPAGVVIWTLTRVTR